MSTKEAIARIKINHLLEGAGWRFFDNEKGQANICLEPKVKVTSAALDDLGSDFEKTSNGFIDFLLLNSKGFPFIVLEAKSENKSPLIGKEQARKYARSQNCRFVILSNGNLHYFWDLDKFQKLFSPTDFNPVEFDGIKKQAGLNSFMLTLKQSITKTHATGVFSKVGRYGGTCAYENIVFEFASWISADCMISRMQKEFDVDNVITSVWTIEEELTFLKLAT